MGMSPASSAVLLERLCLAQSYFTEHWSYGVAAPHFPSVPLTVQKQPIHSEHWTECPHGNSCRLGVGGLLFPVFLQDSCSELNTDREWLFGNITSQWDFTSAKQSPAVQRVPIAHDCGSLKELERWLKKEKMKPGSVASSWRHQRVKLP